MAEGRICRRCKHWNAAEQLKGTAARCDYWTVKNSIRNVPLLPSSAFVMTIGHDTCPVFELAEHDEHGRRVDQ